MAFNTLDLKNSAAQLAAKAATQPATIKTTAKPKIFTAAQATTAVQNYAKSIDSSSLESIVANYQWVFDAISTAAAQGDSNLVITTTNFDYTYIEPLLIGYGYTVSDLPSSATNPSDTTLKYDVTITWPSSTPKPITGITPSSFIAIQNSPYSVTFVPQGGQGPYTFTLTGQLPTGWTYSGLKKVNNITIQGTSSELGGGSLIVSVIDSISQSFTATINWTVTQPAQIQADWNVTTNTSLNYIRNKPTKYYLGSTELNWPGTSSPTPVPLTGIASIDGNAATVTNGIYTDQEYEDPDWLVSLDGAKITNSVALADALTTARTINNNLFDGTFDITIADLIKNSSSVSLNNGALTFNNGQGATINGAFGANGNGIQIKGSSLNPNGPGNVHILAEYNGNYNEITLNGGAIGIRSATADGLGGSTSPYTAFTLTPNIINVNGTITLNGLVQFTGGTSGLTKANVGLSNVDNVSSATLLNNTTFTGTSIIPTATITTANITAGTLTTVNNTATSLVNKQYVDTKAFFALAVGF